MPNYEVDISGLDTLTLRIRAAKKEIKEEIYDILGSASALAEAEWKALIPYRQGNVYRTIRNNGITYSPGGEGGGGFYELELQVGGTPESGHLEFFTEGTGLYGPRNDLIFSPRGNVMVFTAYSGDKVFTRYTRGQEAQTEWIISGQRIADEYIRTQIAELDLFGDG